MEGSIKDRRERVSRAGGISVGVDDTSVEQQQGQLRNKTMESEESRITAPAHLVSRTHRLSGLDMWGIEWAI